MTAAFYCKHDKIHHFPCCSYHIGRNPPQVHHSYLTIKIFFALLFHPEIIKGGQVLNLFKATITVFLPTEEYFTEVQKYTSVEKYSTEGVKKLFQFGTLST